MDLIVMYSGEFGERVIGNLVNHSTFCRACGEACVHCKEGLYGFAADIPGIFQLPPPAQLPVVIECSPRAFLPPNLPVADVAIISELHPDLLLELPALLKDSGSGIQALIVPLERPDPLARAQLEELCLKEGLEIALPKPFCELQPQEDQPVLKRFVETFKIGRPELTIELDRRERIQHVRVIRSAPCGSTWYVAKQLERLNALDTPALFARISEAHHAYPCTASMARDRELEETILHKAGYLIRAAVEAGLHRSSTTGQRRGESFN
jgi:hypothetical protein